MIEVEGKTRIKIEITINEAIDVLYKECIAKGKSENNHNAFKLEEVLKAINNFKKYYDEVKDLVRKNNLDKINVEGIMSNSAQLNAYNTTFYVESEKVLEALVKWFYSCYNTISLTDSNTFANSVSLGSAVSYLERYYNVYVNGMSPKLKIEPEIETKSNYLCKLSREYGNCSSEKYKSMFNRDKEAVKQLNEIIRKLGKKYFINYWEFLEIPMNSSLRIIKTAYTLKYERIEESLSKGSNEYTPVNLITLNNALATLSDPYLRYIHNCRLYDKEPLSYEDYRNLSVQEPEEDYDLENNDKLSKFIAGKIIKYTYGNRAFGMQIGNEIYDELNDAQVYNLDEVSKKINEQNAIKLGLDEVK